MSGLSQDIVAKLNSAQLKLQLQFEFLSKPRPNLNTTVGFDMKMTLQTPPHPTTETFQALLDDLES